MGQQPANSAKSVSVDSSSANIPTAFSTAAGSRFFNGTLNPAFRGTIIVDNGAATKISIVMTESSTAPDSAVTTKLYVPASSSRIFENITIYAWLWVQSEGSAISSGVVDVTVIS